MMKYLISIKRKPKVHVNALKSLLNQLFAGAFNHPEVE